MNLLEFQNKISSDKDNNLADVNVNFFSEQVTMYNILNGTFPDKDIVNVHITSEDSPTFAVTLSKESIAENAEQNLDKQIVPGAYRPLYELNVTRNDKTLFFQMKEI